MIDGRPLPGITTLRDGTEVAGKHYRGAIAPLHYANRTQAEKAAAWWRDYGFRGATVIQRGRPFYVAINERFPFTPKGVTP